MRTTVTLDDDLVATLRRLAQERGLSFKEALNTSLRAGLRPGRTDRSRYRMPTRRLGLREGIDLDKALDLVADLEDAETVRKLELRK